MTFRTIVAAVLTIGALSACSNTQVASSDQAVCNNVAAGHSNTNGYVPEADAKNAYDSCMSARRSR